MYVYIYIYVCIIWLFFIFHNVWENPNPTDFHIFQDVAPPWGPAPGAGDPTADLTISSWGCRFVSEKSQRSQFPKPNMLTFDGLEPYMYIYIHYIYILCI